MSTTTPSKQRIEHRLATIAEALSKAPVSPVLFYLATLLISIGVTCILLWIFLKASASTNPLLLTGLLASAVGGALFGLHLSRNRAFITSVGDALHEYRARLEYLAIELERFINDYDRKTHDHIHSLTSTKIRSYFVLQAALQKIQSEARLIATSIVSPSTAKLLEAAETALAPLKVQDSPLSPVAMDIPREQIEDFLDEVRLTLTKETDRALRSINKKP
jgi:glucose-6-phosphate-specific signal transduction histidine kinase